MDTFAEALRKARTGANLSQQQLADTIAVSRTMIGLYESETRPALPSRDRVLRIAEALELSPVNTDRLLAAANYQLEYAARPSELTGLVQFEEARITHLVVEHFEVADTQTSAPGFYLPPVSNTESQQLNNLVESLQSDVSRPRSLAPSFLAISPYQIREPVADFVGRTTEIDRVVQALRHATKRGGVAAISGVRGMGGIGKTELACMIAQRLVSDFPDGQLLLEMQGAGAPISPSSALQQVLYAFGIEIDPLQELSRLKSMYRTVLAGKKVLILADDAWDAVQVRPLLPPAGCALLITSRQRFTLPGMAMVDLHTLQPGDARQLLLSICPRIGQYASRLANVCGYLPLALRVSASMLVNDDTLRIERYLERLTDERTRLSELGSPNDPDLNVEASLTLSYKALDETAQQVLSEISVFAGSFDLAAAQAVVYVTGEVESILGQLRQRSMLEWDEATNRYSVHDLVRVLAISYLGNSEAAVLQRYYVWSLQEALRDLVVVSNSEQQVRLREQVRINLEYLWEQLAIDLREIAQSWIHKGKALDVEPLALNMFYSMIIALPTVQFDRSEDMRNLLLALARRGIFDEYGSAINKEGRR